MVKKDCLGSTKGELFLDVFPVLLLFGLAIFGNDKRAFRFFLGKKMFKGFVIVNSKKSGSLNILNKPA